MALHISIDVDDTIVTPDDLLIEGVREVLEVLHRALDQEGNPRFRLQLWSTAGHERARDMARRHNLERFFESFATKPDVAVDDKPVSTHPSLVLEVNSAFSLQDAVRVLMHERFEAAIDAVIEKESPLLAAVKHLQALAVENPYAELRSAGTFFRCRSLAIRERRN